MAQFLTRIAFYTEIIFMGIDPSRPVASYYNIRKKFRAFEWYRSLEEQPEFARDIAWHAVADCLHLRDSLSSITHAWREVGLCCNELATILDLADKSLEPASYLHVFCAALRECSLLWFSRRSSRSFDTLWIRSM